MQRVSHQRPPHDRCCARVWTDSGDVVTAEELEIYARYYESEEDRARDLAEFPNSNPPPRENPPFSRDWRLPKGPS